MKLAFFTALLVTVALVSQAEAWGRDGHQIVARLAEDHLTPAAKAGVAKILAANNAKSMADIAPWADSYDHSPEGRWSAPLHYAYTGGVPYFDAQHHCTALSCVSRESGQQLKNCQNCCVVAAVRAYHRDLCRTARGAESNQSIDDKDSFFNFKMIVHYVGDLHQPFHIGMYNDRGGNSYPVTWMGSGNCGYGRFYQCNIHSIWDSKIILKTMKDNYGGSQDKYLDYLRETYGPDEKNLGDVNIEEWASESAEIEAMAYGGVKSCVCDKRKDNGFCIHRVWADKCNIGQNYYAGAAKVVDMQLFRAGMHLATVLNNIFDSTPADDACGPELAPMCTSEETHNEELQWLPSEMPEGDSIHGDREA